MNAQKRHEARKSYLAQISRGYTDTRTAKAFRGLFESRAVTCAVKS